MLLSISLPRRTSFPVGSAPGLRIWILRVGRSTPTRLPASPAAARTLGCGLFTAETCRPLPPSPPTSLTAPPVCQNLVSLSFQWPSVAWFAFSSAIVNECRMRPHSSRPLQYEDGVGGSQRGAPSSGTNTGNRRAGKCRHGKTRGFEEYRTHTGVFVGVAVR